MQIENPVRHSRSRAFDEVVRTSAAGPLRPVQDADRRHLVELLHAVGADDRTAFTAFYRQTNHRVLGYALWLLHNRAMAEEISQEVYMQVWLFASRYDEQMSSPMNWLRTLTHRRSVDRIRAESAAIARDSDFGRLNHARDHDVVFEAVEQMLDERAVVRGLRELTPLQRETIVLAYYGGLTYPEVAERLGKPVGTVKSRIRDGLRHLAICLADDGSH
ncbi:sigma-70 family RNA polymerase sigma factor [Nocardia sp. CA2R105]|uniref:sigma-70 family RNA polymerase sigma factor n=1 Tax=Nocardia coffeae TaxID=2873381 RepID=UPI001CA65DD5|nr:sigma-70 family RNA polymerase sigma factor [Nocardia coffeae]MBY8856119.1 sigma-70 family RNA polymerase sigma factor [Nocardia coffeae]